jgi:hypothetical protein
LYTEADIGDDLLDAGRKAAEHVRCCRYLVRTARGEIGGRAPQVVAKALCAEGDFPVSLERSRHGTIQGTRSVMGYLRVYPAVKLLKANTSSLLDLPLRTIADLQGIIDGATTKAT